MVRRRTKNIVTKQRRGGSSMIELGVTGLTQWGGYVDEEWMRKLQSERGRKIYREMADNDAVIGSILFAIEMILRNVDWSVEPFDDNPDRVEDAEFVESCMNDMSQSWEDFIAEVLSMLVFGFSVHEIVYKRRDGYQSAGSRRPTSKHRDGKIGWRKFPIRAQETIDRWEFDEDGGVAGVWQTPPLGGTDIFIPIEKMLLFRTTARKNNPEGRSILRNAYITWYHKSRIENFEAIGIERDLAGLPILYVPQDLMASDADADTQALLSQYKKIIQNVRNDEQAGLLLPSQFDENNNRTLSFELAGTGSRRLFDTSAIISRKTREIAMTSLADFIMLGHEKVGSYALSSDKTELFATALGAWLKEIAAVLNRHAIPRLYAVNDMDPAEPASIVPADLEQADIDRFTSAVERLTAAGFLTPGSEQDEDHLRERLAMPPTPTDLREELEEEDQERMDNLPAPTDNPPADEDTSDDNPEQAQEDLT